MARTHRSSRADVLEPGLEGVGRGFGISFGVGLPQEREEGTVVTVFLPRAMGLSQVGPDMNEVVSDQRQSDPATDAVGSFI